MTERSEFNRITFRVSKEETPNFYERVRREFPNAFVLGENLTAANHREAEWVADISRTKQMINATVYYLSSTSYQSKPHLISVRGFARLINDTEELREERNLNMKPDKFAAETIAFFRDSVIKHQKAGIPVAYLLQDRGSYYRDIDDALDPRQVRVLIEKYGCHGKYVRPKEIEKREDIKYLSPFLERVRSKLVAGLVKRENA